MKRHSAKLAFGCLRWMALALFVTACDRPKHFQVLLERGESVRAGDPVYVDTLLAGQVERIEREGEDVFADLSISRAETYPRLRVGTVRVRESDKILLRTETVGPDSELLPNGARIPTDSRVGYLIRKYSRGTSAATVGGTIVAILLLGRVLRSVIGSIGLILSFAVAGVATQTLHGYLVPTIASAMDRLAAPGPRPVNSPPPTVAPILSNPTSADARPDSLIADASTTAERAIREVMTTRPSPEVVTWCVVFLVCFVTVSSILGKASRAWKA